jgi:ApbE superfamily uncharacterized protein (UPF0280 family)
VFERAIHRLQGGSVLAESGPMRLVISAFLGKLPQPDMAVRAARESFVFLEAAAEARRCLGRMFETPLNGRKNALLDRMVESVSAVGDEELTPMAAVAGTIADEVADFLFVRGMTKVVVENGGDISVRLQGDESVTVGIRPRLDGEEISHVIALDPSRTAWGVATSGLGGRSLTRGVASAATVVAHSASLADAAATAVANATLVADRQVVQRPAQEVDPYTDIPGLLVTVSAGPLGQRKKRSAVGKAIHRAEELISRNIILGAFVTVQGEEAMTPYLRDKLVEEV